MRRRHVFLERRRVSVDLVEKHSLRSLPIDADVEPVAAVLVGKAIGRLQADGEDINFLFGSYPPGGAASASGALAPGCAGAPSAFPAPDARSWAA